MKFLLLLFVSLNCFAYLTPTTSGSSGSSTWGSISGTLSSQADLQSALDLKELLSNKDTDSTMTANSDTKYASQKAVKTALALKANLASPALTGSPTTPTQTASDNSTKIASTAYVDTGLSLKTDFDSGEFFISMNDYNTATAYAGWTSSVTGTGTFAAASDGINATENCIGTVRSSVAAVNDRVATNRTAMMYLGNGSGYSYSFKHRAAFITALPDGTNTVNYYIGVNPSSTGNGTTEPTDGVYLRYNPTVNSGKFQAVNRTGSSDTEALDTGFAPTVDVFSVYEVRISSAGVATFYINGALVATSTTTLSVPGSTVLAFTKLLKTAGAGTIIISNDYGVDRYSRTAVR